jgi:manganese transport protein
MMFARFKNIGPGALVAAAFVGPGTITTCTLAGASFGYALLWSLVFATIATIILQEMSARLGIITQKGLGEVLRESLDQSIWKGPLIALVIIALYLGNCAFEAGNLSGAALGIQAIGGDSGYEFNHSVAAISIVAAILLWIGGYKFIEKILIFLVLVMAVSFITTFFIVKPDLVSFFKGLFIPKIPSGSLMLIIALIGTTVIPYNLFLHASAVKDKWSDPDDLNAARTDTVVAVGLGGLITIMIASTAAVVTFGTGLEINGAGDMAKQLEPLYGTLSKYILGIGFFAAGLSSGLTAPLATSYAMTEILGIQGGVNSKPFKFISLSVIISGATVALTGIQPVKIILTAQFANGILLPVIAGFLLFAMNRKKLLGVHANSTAANILGGGIVVIMLGFGARLILLTLGVI